MSQLDYQLTRRDNLLARQQPCEPRRCLSCEHWMRSTGPEHRICNVCKGDRCHYDAVATGKREGARLLA